MTTFWFCALAAMIGIYVVLDGYDLGAGMAQLILCRSEDERTQVLQSIHPLWDGNEVWLIATGTTLFFAFPKLYAVSFSGFYLPLMIVLWLLVLRGISIEFRSQIDSPAWKPLWDFVFGWASAALVTFLGVALGNVVRGVPLNEHSRFFLPLWTNFRFATSVGVLDWYTVSIGVCAGLTLLHHGALWIALRTEGSLETRARALARHLWPVVVLAITWTTYFSFDIQKLLMTSFMNRPWGVVFPFVGLLGLIGARLWNSQYFIVRAFICSCFLILGLLSSVAFGLFPYLLPATTGIARGLTIANSAAPDVGLQQGLFWFVPGMLLAVGYSVFVHMKFSGKVKIVTGH